MEKDKEEEKKNQCQNTKSQSAPGDACIKHHKCLRVPNNYCLHECMVPHFSKWDLLQLWFFQRFLLAAFSLGPEERKEDPSGWSRVK